MSEISSLVVAVVIISILGGIVLWILGRLCTSRGPALWLCALGALLTEILLLLPIPVLPFIVLYTLFVAPGKVHGFPAFVSVMVFMVLRLGVVGGVTMFVQSFT